MNNNQYIATLTKALSGLEKTSRNDIVHEIQSHADESGDTLRERFGSPEELAQQYLEGEAVAEPIGAKMWGISKKLLIAIGVTVIALIIIGSIILWWVQRDAFNYEDDTAKELTEEKAEWTTKEWSGNLNIAINEASLVAYWHNEANVRYRCDNQASVKFDDSELVLSHNKCLVYLPSVPVTIKANRAQIVLIQPQHSLDLDLTQADLRIAERGTDYRYSIDSTRTSVKDLTSVAGAEFEILIKSFEASISKYSY